MYWLIFRVRLATSPKCGGNGTAHAAGASILLLARGVFAGMRSAWHSVRRAVGLADNRWALPRTCSVAIATQPVQRLQIRPTAGIPYQSSKLYPGPWNSVRMRRRIVRQTQTNTHTHTHTHTQTRVTTIRFALSATHAKCNNRLYMYTADQRDKLSSTTKRCSTNRCALSSRTGT